MCWNYTPRPQPYARAMNVSTSPSEGAADEEHAELLVKLPEGKLRGS